MKCPRCVASDLHHRDLGEREAIGVEQCSSCHGCWVDVAELERLESGTWSRVDDLRLTVVEALSELLCPRCSARMATMNPDDHAELAIDRCPTCHGLWLDAGELARLHVVAVEHVAAHGGLKQRPDGWSHLRWASYRVAEHWKQIHG